MLGFTRYLAKWIYIIFIINSVQTSASSKVSVDISINTTKDILKSLPLAEGDMTMVCASRPGIVELPIYSVYLIGFTIFFMSLAIIGLSGVLFYALKKKTILKINDSNKVQYTSFDDTNKNNGSTLTVNSGIIQISESRRNDPITPTRNEDAKIIFAKKPLKPTGPILGRVQMDALCKEVLEKMANNDFACYRDLNDLLKFENKEDNSSTKGEDIKENKNKERTEFEAVKLFKLKKPEIKTVKKETENKIKLEIKDETKQETKNEKTKETETQTKLDENIDVRIEINNVESYKNEGDSDSETEYDTVSSPIRFRHSGPDPEQTIYDTVPNPMRFRHSDPEPDQGMYDTVASPKRLRNSGADTDNSLDDIPFYDLPPRRNQNGPSKNVIQIDSESHYLMPISADTTDSCYINAKKPLS